MEEKKFNCKMEDVPVITGFVLMSLENDLESFAEFSPIFDSQFITSIKAKQTECYELTKTSEVLKLQKVVTNKITEKSGLLRVSLNQLEGYLKLSNGGLDIHVNDFGLKSIRTAIGKGNVEGIISDARSMLANVKRNEAVLQGKGMKPEFIAGLTAMIQEIELLNTHQNVKKNERSRVSVDNIKVFNELWELLNTVLETGRALYRGVDDVKLKEYTMSNLQKRVHTDGGSNAKSTEVPPVEKP